MPNGFPKGYGLGFSDRIVMIDPTQRYGVAPPKSTPYMAKLSGPARTGNRPTETGTRDARHSLEGLNSFNYKP